MRILLIALCCGLGSCSLLNTPPEALARYLLETAFESSPTIIGDGPTLLVSLPQAAPGLEQADLLYQREPYRWNAYSQSQWIDAPSRLLLPLLVQYLERSGRFAAVLSANTGSIGGQWRLDTELLRLHQVFRSATGQPGEVQLVLRAQLLDMLNSEVLITRTFVQTVETGSEDAAGAVAAANQAVQQVLTELTALVVKQLATGQPENRSETH